MQKHCPKCGQDKPLTAEFWLPRADSKDGYRGYCRLCWYDQQRPNKRRHYQRHAGRIRAEQRQRRARNLELFRLRNMRYSLTHREQRKAYNRRYYWLNHERLLAYARWYAKSVRPLRIDSGIEMPNDRTVDMYLWQLSQNRQQAQQAAVDILTLMTQGLTEDERRFLLAFEAAGHDLATAANHLGITETVAAQRMAAIRRCAKGAREVIRRELWPTNLTPLPLLPTPNA